MQVRLEVCEIQPEMNLHYQQSVMNQQCCCYVRDVYALCIHTTEVSMLTG